MSKLANVFSKKEKKELTPEQQKKRTILSWVVNILSIIVIVFALVVAVLTIVRVTNSNGVTSLFGKVYMNVMSDSMEPTFAKGDVIIANEFKGDASSLKVGQVVTFKSQIRIGNAYYESFNTHRIVQITSSGIIYTRGDNQNKKDGQDWKEYTESLDGTITESVSASDVVAVWGDVDGEMNFTPGKVLKGAGLMSNWLHDPEKGRTRFFCVIVLPLILLFVAYAFVLVRTLIIAKLEKDKAVQADTTVTVDSLSDEEKRRLAEEYLASLAAQKAEEGAAEVPSEEPAPAEEPAEEPAPAEVPSEEPKDELPTPESVAEDSNETL